MLICIVDSLSHTIHIRSLLVNITFSVGFSSQTSGPSLSNLRSFIQHLKHLTLKKDTKIPQKTSFTTLFLAYLPQPWCWWSSSTNLLYVDEMKLSQTLSYVDYKLTFRDGLTKINSSMIFSNLNLYVKSFILNSNRKPISSFMIEPNRLDSNLII